MGLHMKTQNNISNDENIEDKMVSSSKKIGMDDTNSRMITDDISENNLVSRLQQQIEQLQEEKESLKIDNVCLQQQNYELKNRIDDVATHFPKTSILLGKKPVEQKNQFFKFNLKKKK